MTSGSLLTVLLPLALGVIMLGLGLSLTLADFRRVAQHPRAGRWSRWRARRCCCRWSASRWRKAFGLAPALAVGLMLLAASPGGTTANLYSHLAHGDVALNITLTAVNSRARGGHAAAGGEPVAGALHGRRRHASPLQFDKVLQVFAIVLVPVAIGMVVRARRTGLRRPHDAAGQDRSRWSCSS